MDIKDLIAGTFEDYWSRLDAALDGLTSDELAWQPNTACNPISFIVWHMARVEDRWLHSFARGSEDLWVQQGWDKQLVLGASEHGVGFTLEQLAAFPAISQELLVGYLAAVQDDTRAFLQACQTEELDVVPGRIPFPPNIPRGAEAWSVGRMFRQLFGELNQHLGQVRYLRGIIKGFNQ
jgi:hypothetical protein